MSDKSKQRTRAIQKLTGNSYGYCLEAFRKAQTSTATDAAKSAAAIVALAYFRKNGHADAQSVGRVIGCSCGFVAAVMPELPAPHFEDFALMIGNCAKRSA